MERRRVLFIGGSMNQTTMMVQIAEHLGHHDCWFTPHYTDGVLLKLENRRLLEWTVAGKRHQERSLRYLHELGLQIDLRGERNDYDLVVTCADLIVPKNIRNKPIVLVQEGMTDPENLLYYLVKHLKLPRYLASTSTFGLSDAYVKMCVASEGYREHFERKGVRRNKIVVTGIPNFDNCAAYRDVPCQKPEQPYVLVATSDARETFKFEDRERFIRTAVQIAGERALVFKLHPNENVERAVREIARWAPQASVLFDCDINPLIAHCDALVTRFSTVVYVGIALGKTVYSEFPLESLYHMCPIQNGGRSAQSIARVCQGVLDELPHAVDNGLLVQSPNYEPVLARVG